MKANYILSVKNNQRDLYEDIQDSFSVLPPADFHEDLDYGHGRIETRKCTILTDLSLVENALKWESIRSIVKLERERYFKASGKRENETSFYISTLDSATNISQGIRKHWGIENKVHWVLDVGFSEDLSRKRAGNAAKNFTNLNRIALNLLKQKLGLRVKEKWQVGIMTLFLS